MTGLHEGELAVDDELVRELLRRQAPTEADLPLVRVVSTGTVNHVFRLGDRLAVRLPRLPRSAPDLERETALFPVVAPVLPVAMPEPVLLGRPDPDLFALPWAVVTWIDGDVGTAGRIDVDDLVAVVTALRTIEPGSLPPAGRPSARDADGAVRESIGRLTGVDRGRVTDVWQRALGAPVWDGARVAIHGDLLPPNLVIRGSRLAGVLDWGAAGAGDPANDLVPAWSCLRGTDRARFRAALAPDDGTRARARSIALEQAVGAIPYYDRTNPAFAALCRSTLAEVLADGDAD